MILLHPYDLHPTASDDLTKLWRRSAAARGGDARLAAELALEEARKKKRWLTVIAEARGLSTCPWLVKGRTGLIGIPRRRSCWRRVRSDVDGGEATGHDKAK